MRNSTIGDHPLGTWMIQMMMTMITVIMEEDPLVEDHPITLGIMGEDGTLRDLVEITGFQEEGHWMEDHQEEDLGEEVTKIIPETQDNNKMMVLSSKRKLRFRKYLNGMATLTKFLNG